MRKATMSSSIGRRNSRHLSVAADQAIASNQGCFPGALDVNAETMRTNGRTHVQNKYKSLPCVGKHRRNKACDMRHLPVPLLKEVVDVCHDNLIARHRKRSNLTRNLCELSWTKRQTRTHNQCHDAGSIPKSKSSTNRSYLLLCGSRCPSAVGTQRIPITHFRQGAKADNATPKRRSGPIASCKLGGICNGQLQIAVMIKISKCTSRPHTHTRIRIANVANSCALDA